MASNAEMVGEFRRITDGVILRQVDQCQNGPGLRSTWRDYDKVAVNHGLIFTSVDQRDARTNAIPHSEAHVWAVSPEKEQLLEGYKYSGWIAIVSFANEDGRLFRNWSFRSGMDLINPSTLRPVEDPKDVEDVLAWVKSPHIYPDSLNKVAQLSDDERPGVDAALEDLSKASAELHRDLAELARQRHRPIPDIGPIAG